MDTQIQALTEKVYNEGVNKGKEEATRLIEEAKAYAAKLEAEAKTRAEKIVRDAECQSNELKQNTERELRLQANQLIDATRASLIEQLTGEIATANVQAMQTNPEFIQSVILELVKGFDISKGVEVSTSIAEKLEAYFAQNAKHLLEQGVTIKQVAGKTTDFTLRPVDGSFKLQIGEAEFAELFKSILRPQLAQQLF